MTDQDRVQAIDGGEGDFWKKGFDHLLAESERLASKMGSDHLGIFETAAFEMAQGMNSEHFFHQTDGMGGVVSRSRDSLRARGEGRVGRPNLEVVR